MLMWHQLLGKPRVPQPYDSQSGTLLGPAFTSQQTATVLDRLDAVYEQLPDSETLSDRVAGYLADGKVVGWMQGRMEFGPRALGSRSILGDPRSTEMQTVMNLKIKFRESFRPFAPSVLADRASDYFDMPPGTPSPYMLLVFDVCESLRRPPTSDGQAGLERVREVRSDLPAITHVDYSARVQTVDRHRHPAYEQLLRAFQAQTGCPVLINTSFNVRGEPIVCTPEDAFRCFMATNMDVLVIDQTVLLKTDQRNAPAHEIDEHLARFQLD